MGPKVVVWKLPDCLSWGREKFCLPWCEDPTLANIGILFAEGGQEI